MAEEALQKPSDCSESQLEGKTEFVSPDIKVVTLRILGPSGEEWQGPGQAWKILKAMEELELEVGKGQHQWQLSPEAGEASGNPRLRVTEFLSPLAWLPESAL